MSKPLSLLFACGGLFWLICTGIALSYRNAWIALLMVVIAVFWIGAGFIVKAKLRK